MSQPATPHYHRVKSVGDVIIRLAAKSKFIADDATPKDAVAKIQYQMQEKAGMSSVTTRRILRGYNRDKNCPGRPSIQSLMLFATVFGNSKDDFWALFHAAYPEVQIMLDMLDGGCDTGDLDEALMAAGLDPISTLA